VNIRASIEFHKAHGKLSTITAVQPPGRYGALKMAGSKVESFMEKPKGDGGVINGGFFVLNSKVIEYIKEDATIWEKEPMEKLAADGQMQAFVHQGFWQPMDTLRDKKHLEELWNSGKAPWKIW
ncbi:MAG: sugar phosphate nucleotidyltransferase, partial [Pseudobdellovibrionaceae bacterium]